MASPVEQVLTEIGPGISSRTTEKLIAKGMKPEAARQQVSRAKGHVKRLFALNLPKGEKFIYLESQFGTELYWQALTRDLDATKSVSFRLFALSPMSMSCAAISSTARPASYEST
jgi:hypothetical protein